MLHHVLFHDDGLLTLTPDGPLKSIDVERVEQAVETFIEERGQLNGLMLHNDSFSDWTDIVLLLSQLSFVRDRHKHIRRVAVIADDEVTPFLPRLAQLFSHAEVRLFGHADDEAALLWLRSTHIDPIQT